MRETRDFAVTFADIASSTRFYRELGDEAAREVTGAFCAHAETLAPRFGGRLVKTLGDGVMCVFPDAEKAILAMSALHAEISAAKPKHGMPLQLHTGINAGPVIVDDEDVYGTIVNVAAYLAATARAEQILTTEAVIARLPPATAACARAIYTTKLKGDETESLIYEVLWHPDRAAITEINLGRPRHIQGDEGALLLTLGQASVRMDPSRPRLTLGRDAANALAVDDSLTSRSHATIELDEVRFRLIDHSVNGTYVSFDGSPGELLVLRGETLLHGAGRISLGRSLADPRAQPIRFERDQRALFRV